MNQKIQKLLCAAAAALCVGAAGFGFSAMKDTQITAKAESVADIAGTKRYLISSPYKDVDWDTWGHYKVATHVHSDISDGNIKFAQQIENYYGLGYDCLGMTDHGTVNYGWSADKSRLAIFSYQAFSYGSAKGLTETRNTEISSGVGRNGRGMIDIPMGIELNGSSTDKCHINGFFADAGHGDLELSSSGVSGCVTAVSKNHAAGGLTHINHVGEFMSANDQATLADCKANVYTQSFINDFANKVFRTYNSCVGMELVNKGDSRTKYDRYLYDELLMRLAPEGRGIWGFCEDDAHKDREIAKNVQTFMMPSNTAANVRTAMETGAFFASTINANGDLPTSISHTDFQVHNYPMVNRITTDDVHSRITLEVVNADNAVLITGDSLGNGGKIIDTVVCNTAGSVVTFDLNKYEKDITKGYVRVYFTGPDGITYVQPFYLTEEAYASSVPVSFNVTMNDQPTTNFSVSVKNSKNVLVPMENYKLIHISEPETYTYTVSSDGYAPVTGSFVITDADFVNSASYSFDISLENIPELVFDTAQGVQADESTGFVTGLTLGKQVGEIAVSSNSNGTVEVVPTENGYGTGTKVNLVYNGRVIETYTYVIYGDTDGDAIADATDSILLEAFLNPNIECEIPPEALRACDVNNDGYYDKKDIEILRGIGMEKEYTIEQNR